MNLFQKGQFTLNSGPTAHFKIECDALTNDDWECLAFLLFNRLPAFSSVEGVPTGGLKLAEAMKKYTSSEGPLLIVDDVLTTGGSMERFRGIRPAIGAVVFARAACDVMHWVTPLFVMK
jgi:orotate phosphoribosyltransferase